MEEKELNDHKNLLEQAEEIKKELNLGSIDTAILMLIYQEIDTIRFHNCD